MPIIKSAKKRLKQSIKNRKRNFPKRSMVKSSMRRIFDLVKDGKKENINKELAEAYSNIDTAAKHGIIHPKNAARKKSRLARAVATLDEKAKKKAA